MPAFAPVESPELVFASKGVAEAAAEPDVAGVAEESIDVAAAEEAAALDEVEKSERSFCWKAIVRGCAHIVTRPKSAPSKTDVTMSKLGALSRVTSGRASTVVVTSELNVDMHPARPPPALSPAVAEETVYLKPLHRIISRFLKHGLAKNSR
jgi:hypothetical protein